MLCFFEIKKKKTNPTNNDKPCLHCGPVNISENCQKKFSKHSLHAITKQNVLAQWRQIFRCLSDIYYGAFL